MFGTFSVISNLDSTLSLLEVVREYKCLTISQWTRSLAERGDVPSKALWLTLYIQALSFYWSSWLRWLYFNLIFSNFASDKGKFYASAWPRPQHKSSAGKPLIPGAYQTARTCFEPCLAFATPYDLCTTLTASLARRYLFSLSVPGSVGARLCFVLSENWLYNEVPSYPVVFQNFDEI